MPRIPFQKPRKVEWEILTDRYGRLVAEPFEKGYALTVGHSLRRTLLNIVPGSAVSWVKIDGLKSADQPIAGVTESTADVLLNLKKLTIQVPAGEPRTVRVEVSGPKTVTGADVPETDIEVINPETHLFTLGAGAKVSMELGIGVGRGYEALDKKTGSVPAGALPLDAAYSPITRIAYTVDPSRLGKITDYEKLVIEIWTNGAVSPEDALERAAGFLRGHFSPLAAGAPVEEAGTEGASGEEDLRDAPRRARLRNMLAPLPRHERIETTGAKAKAVRGLADHMVTLAKRESLHARRQALSMMPDTEVVRRLFDQIGARYADRHGGYTRIIHAGVRRGDGAPVVYLELVDRPETPPDGKGKKGEKKERPGKGEGKAQAESGGKRKKKEKAAAASA